ncbi:unnamed protein product, partial [Brenthis ino]
MESNLKSIRPGKKKGDPVVVDIKGLKYLSDGSIFYRLRHVDEWSVLPQRKNNQRNDFISPRGLYKSPIKITESEYKHLQELKMITKCLGDLLNLGDGHEIGDLSAIVRQVHGARSVRAKSDGSLAGAGAEEGGALGAGGKARSRSLEPLTGLAMWSSEPQIIELVKGERGLGFSILDYQDPLRPSHTLVVIRSLVPGGVAQQDGRLIPGDRLLFVNDQNLENASLEQAVAALKGAPRGAVRIGVAKPLPLADAPPPPLPASAPPASNTN